MDHLPSALEIEQLLVPNTNGRYGYQAQLLEEDTGAQE
jgi:hypothetical protein